MLDQAPPLNPLTPYKSYAHSTSYVVSELCADDRPPRVDVPPPLNVKNWSHHSFLAVDVQTLVECE